MKKPSSDSQEEEHLHWVQNHHMVDVIKLFIRTEQLADHNGHLSCIVTKILRIFAAAGHHQYTKGTWLELIKDLEHLSAYKNTLQRVLANEKNVVLYSSHEYPVLGVTFCFEQTLMKAARRWSQQRENEKHFFLATNAWCSPSVTSLMLTCGWRKTSVNMFHATQTFLKH